MWGFDFLPSYRDYGGNTNGGGGNKNLFRAVSEIEIYRVARMTSKRYTDV